MGVRPVKSNEDEGTVIRTEVHSQCGLTPLHKTPYTPEKMCECVYAYSTRRKEGGAKEIPGDKKSGIKAKGENCQKRKRKQVQQLVLLVKLQAVVSGESWLLLRLGALMLPSSRIVRQKIHRGENNLF
jgi:hypothetical protein